MRAGTFSINRGTHDSFDGPRAGLAEDDFDPDRVSGREVVGHHEEVAGAVGRGFVLRAFCVDEFHERIREWDGRALILDYGPRERKGWVRRAIAAMANEARLTGAMERPVRHSGCLSAERIDLFRMDGIAAAEQG
jgi:hypothetical protein